MVEKSSLDPIIQLAELIKQGTLPSFKEAHEILNDPDAERVREFFEKSSEDLKMALALALIEKNYRDPNVGEIIEKNEELLDFVKSKYGPSYYVAKSSYYFSKGDVAKAAEALANVKLDKNIARKLIEGLRKADLKAVKDNPMALKTAHEAIKLLDREERLRNYEVILGLVGSAPILEVKKYVNNDDSAIQALRIIRDLGKKYDELPRAVKEVVDHALNIIKNNLKSSSTFEEKTIKERYVDKIVPIIDKNRVDSVRINEIYLTVVGLNERARKFYAGELYDLLKDIGIDNSRIPLALYEKYLENYDRFYRGSGRGGEIIYFYALDASRDELIKRLPLKEVLRLLEISKERGNYPFDTIYFLSRIHNLKIEYFMVEREPEDRIRNRKGSVLEISFRDPELIEMVKEYADYIGVKKTFDEKGLYEYLENNLLYGLDYNITAIIDKIPRILRDLFFDSELLEKIKNLDLKERKYKAVADAREALKYVYSKPHDLDKALKELKKYAGDTKVKSVYLPMRIFNSFFRHYYDVSKEEIEELKGLEPSREIEDFLIAVGIIAHVEKEEDLKALAERFGGLYKIHYDLLKSEDVEELKKDLEILEKLDTAIEDKGLYRFLKKRYTSRLYKKIADVGNKGHKIEYYVRAFYELPSYSRPETLGLYEFVSNLKRIAYTYASVGGKHYDVVNIINAKIELIKPESAIGNDIESTIMYSRSAARIGDVPKALAYLSLVAAHELAEKEKATRSRILRLRFFFF